jgi:hypothetical protein
VRSALLLVSPFPTAADRAPFLINGQTRDEFVNKTLSFHLEDARTKIAAAVAAITATDRIRPCESLHLGPRCHSPITTDDRLPNPTSSADRPLLRKGFLGAAAEAPLDPNVADVVPSAPTLTAYDQEHLVTCLWLLDAGTD